MNDNRNSTRQEPEQLEQLSPDTKRTGTIAERESGRYLRKGATTSPKAGDDILPLAWNIVSGGR